MRAPSRRALILALGALVLALFLASIAVGPSGWTFLEALTGPGPAPMERLVLIEVRLPRAILGLAVGGVLGLAGAALQGYFRNPLAEPGLLGISSGASLGAVIALYYGLARVIPLALPLGGMAGAAIAALVLLVLAGRGASSVTLILVGVALSALAGALTSLALNMAPSPWAALEIVFWLLGALSDRGLDHVTLALPAILLGGVILTRLGPALDALSLGEEAAASLGVDLGRARILLILGVTLGVGAAVAVSGAIGFVGLVVPHLLRGSVGQRPGALLLPSALGGAALLLAADVLVRLLPTQSELRLGVVTAALGAPFFLWLTLRGREGS